MNQSWAGADYLTINTTVYIEEDPSEDTCPVRCFSVRILRPTIKGHTETRPRI